MITILHGPNLNLLGSREPEIYGHDTLDDINVSIAQHASTYGKEVLCKQTNSEGELVSWVQEAAKGEALIINAGAYTHTSIALLDALKSLTIPIIEVHLSNPHARETFRHTSFVSPAAKGVICGLGKKGYLLALDALCE